MRLNDEDERSMKADVKMVVHDGVDNIDKTDDNDDDYKMGGV